MPAWRPIVVTALRTLVGGGAVSAAACFVALQYEVGHPQRAATPRPPSFVAAQSENSAAPVRAAILRSFWYRETTMHRPRAGWMPLAVDVVIEDAQPGFDVHDVRIADVYAREQNNSFPEVHYLDANGNPVDAIVTTAGGKSAAFRLVYLAPATLRLIRLDYLGEELCGAAIEEGSTPPQTSNSATY